MAAAETLVVEVQSVDKLARLTLIWICEFENRETAMLSSYFRKIHSGYPHITPGTKNSRKTARSRSTPTVSVLVIAWVGQFTELMLLHRS